MAKITSRFYDTTSSANVEPVVDTSKDLELGRKLEAYPTMCLDGAAGERLTAQGIAAKADDGWMRGYKWHQFYG